MDIRPSVNMTKKLIDNDYPLIFMEITRAVVYVKIVSTTQRGSIAINVNLNTIDHTERIGMISMYVQVS